MGEQFGHKIAVGDFNGDGVQDIAVSAPTWFLKNDNKFKVLLNLFCNECYISYIPVFISNI
jgi:hypothetical protein